MKKILVPCDFSAPAIQAFKFAINIARQSKGQVILLHIVELPVLRHAPVPINALEKSYLKNIRVRLAKDVDKLISKWGKGINVSFILEHGTVNQTIVRNIKKYSIDLVIMGSHGASGLREFFLGSNTEKVIRFSPVPVITVKKYFKNTIRNIAFATDLTTIPVKVTKRIKQLQQFFKAQLNIVYVNTPFDFKTDEELRPIISDFISKNEFRKNCSFTIFNDHDETSGVRSFARLNKIDMMVMPTQSRKGLGHFLFGSKTEDVTNHLECPIWTCSLE